MKNENPADYKIVVSELGSNPFQVLDTVFVLMTVIPLLALFYLINKERLLQQLFLGNNGSVAAIAVFISLLGFLYAYILMRNLVARLLKYAQERKLADCERTDVMLAVSHDLKNPLTVIKMSMENLKDGIGGALSSAHATAVKMCLSNIERLFKFIEEITSSSKNDFLRMFIKRELIDLGGIVKQEVDDFMLMAEKASLNLRYQPLGDSVSLWGDKDKLSRVAMNLISNAVKYTPQGGAIDVGLSSDQNTVTFVVTNTGPGLSPNEREQLFKKYGRLSKHSEIEGSGLGLSIVKDIVDLHDGHIAVAGELGKNTEFRVTFPKDLRGKAR